MLRASFHPNVLRYFLRVMIRVTLRVTIRTCYDTSVTITLSTWEYVVVVSGTKVRWRSYEKQTLVILPSRRNKKNNLKQLSFQMTATLQLKQLVVFFFGYVHLCTEKKKKHSHCKKFLGHFKNWHTTSNSRYKPTYHNMSLKSGKSTFLAVIKQFNHTLAH